MKQILETIEAFWTRLSVFKKPDPVRTCREFESFLGTRSAFIAQKTLYGYVKTRMGMKYPTVFKDDVFIESLNIAKWQVYAACLFDLAIYMAARTYALTGDPKEASAIALSSFRAVLDTRFDNPEFTGSTGDLLDAFERRLAFADWNYCSQGEGAFKDSPPALVRWAPIDGALKRYDGEIVRNSIRFQWQRIRHDFETVFQGEEFLADWRRDHPVAA